MPAKVHPYFRRICLPANRGQSPSICGGKYYEKSPENRGQSASIFGGKYDEKTRA
jgi:hypothetical protein